MLCCAVTSLTAWESAARCSLWLGKKKKARRSSNRECASPDLRLGAEALREQSKGQPGQSEGCCAVRQALLFYQLRTLFLRLTVTRRLSAVRFFLARLSPPAIWPLAAACCCFFFKARESEKGVCDCESVQLLSLFVLHADPMRL